MRQARLCVCVCVCVCVCFLSYFQRSQKLSTLEWCFAQRHFSRDDVLWMFFFFFLFENVPCRRLFMKKLVAQCRCWKMLLLCFPNWQLNLIIYLFVQIWLRGPQINIWNPPSTRCGPPFLRSGAPAAGEGAKKNTSLLSRPGGLTEQRWCRCCLHRKDRKHKGNVWTKTRGVCVLTHSDVGGGMCLGWSVIAQGNPHASPKQTGYSVTSESFSLQLNLHFLSNIRQWMLNMFFLFVLLFSPPISIFKLWI